MSALQARSELENSFLDYIASRINWEVGRFRLTKQTEAETGARISALANLTLEVLGSRSEVEAWLQMVAGGPDRAHSRGLRPAPARVPDHEPAENAHFLKTFQQESG
jgi:hypothetical protein